uniref:Uncharacterized protein n=1 Tax=Zea mays TaxID=4577 RepID=A0A804N0N6_MAIZE
MRLQSRLTPPPRISPSPACTDCFSPACAGCFWPPIRCVGAPKFQASTLPPLLSTSFWFPLLGHLIKKGSTRLRVLRCIQEFRER